MLDWHIVGKELLFTPMSITSLIDTEDALLVAHCVNSNGKDLVSDGEKTVDIYQTRFYTNHVKKTRGACVPG